MKTECFICEYIIEPLYEFVKCFLQVLWNIIDNIIPADPRAPAYFTSDLFHEDLVLLKDLMLQPIFCLIWMPILIYRLVEFIIDKNK